MIQPRNCFSCCNEGSFRDWSVWYLCSLPRYLRTVSVFCSLSCQPPCAFDSFSKRRTVLGLFFHLKGEEVPGNLCLLGWPFTTEWGVRSREAPPPFPWVGTTERHKVHSELPQGIRLKLLLRNWLSPLLCPNSPTSTLVFLERLINKSLAHKFSSQYLFLGGPQDNTKT